MACVIARISSKRSKSSNAGYVDTEERERERERERVSL